MTIISELLSILITLVYILSKNIASLDIPVSPKHSTLYKKIYIVFDVKMSDS